MPKITISTTSRQTLNEVLDIDTETAERLVQLGLAWRGHGGDYELSGTASRDVLENVKIRWIAHVNSGVHFRKTVKELAGSVLEEVDFYRDIYQTLMSEVKPDDITTEKWNSVTTSVQIYWYAEAKLNISGQRYAVKSMIERLIASMSKS